MECKHALILIWLSITTQTLSFSPKQLTVSQIIYQKGWFHSNTSIHVTQSIITMNEPNCTSMTLLIHWSCWYKFEFVVYDGAIFKWIKWFSAAKFSILLNNLYLLAKNSNICNHVALSKFLFKPVFGLVSFFYIPSRIFQYSLASVPLAKQSFWQSTLLQYWLIRECLNFFSVKYKRSNPKDAAVNNFFIRV